MNKRLRFFEKDTVDWQGPSLAEFYRAMFALKHLQPALSNGAWGGSQTVVRTDGGERVYVFVRSKGASSVLVAVNFGDAPARAKVEALARPGRYTDWFTKSVVNVAAQGRIDIPAHGYRVLVR